jgi:hypothetical protein
MNSMTLTAALESLLMFPAAIFMASLALRNMPVLELATTAQRIVSWYAGRLWTLWALLFALPFAALTLGCVVLSRKTKQPNVHGNSQSPTRLVEALTYAAAGMLAIVVLHVLRN